MVRRSRIGRLQDRASAWRDRAEARHGDVFVDVVTYALLLACVFAGAMLVAALAHGWARMTDGAVYVGLLAALVVGLWWFTRW